MPSSRGEDYYAGPGPQGFSWRGGVLAPCNYGWRNGCSLTTVIGGVQLRRRLENEKTLPVISTFLLAKRDLTIYLHVGAFPRSVLCFLNQKTTDPLKELKRGHILDHLCTASLEEIKTPCVCVWLGNYKMFDMLLKSSMQP